MHPYETEDLGRFEVTKQETDRFFFKVPSLRNVNETGPYFHDGSVESLDEAIRLMGWHQLGREISSSDRQTLIVFLRSMTGRIDERYIAEPTLPPSGPTTPAPNPN